MRSQAGGITDQAALLTAVAGLVHGSWWNVDHEHGYGGGKILPPPRRRVRNARDDDVRPRRHRRRICRPACSRRPCLPPPGVQPAGQRAGCSQIVARYALVLYAGHGSLPVSMQLPQAVCDVEDALTGYDDDLLIAHRRLEAVFVAEGNGSVMLRSRAT